MSLQNDQLSEIRKLFYLLKYQAELLVISYLWMKASKNICHIRFWHFTACRPTVPPFPGTQMTSRNYMMWIRKYIRRNGLTARLKRRARRIEWILLWRCSPSHLSYVQKIRPPRGRFNGRRGYFMICCSPRPLFTAAATALCYSHYWKALVCRRH